MRRHGGQGTSSRMQVAGGMRSQCAGQHFGCERTHSVRGLHENELTPGTGQDVIIGVAHIHDDSAGFRAAETILVQGF